jgi:hypothetical protein
MYWTGEWWASHESYGVFFQSCVRPPLVLSRGPGPKSGWKGMYRVEKQARIRHRRRPRIVLPQAVSIEGVCG